VSPEPYGSGAVARCSGALPGHREHHPLRHLQRVAAFEDNEAAAAPLGVDGDEVAVVVLAPPETVVPERMPGNHGGRQPQPAQAAQG
jgi:hypothetical protein